MQEGGGKDTALAPSNGPKHKAGSPSSTKNKRTAGNPAAGKRGASQNVPTSSGPGDVKRPKQVSILYQSVISDVSAGIDADLAEFVSCLS